MRRTTTSERRRTRVLSDQEIRLLWPVCEASGVYGAMVQTLLLTAQRLRKVQQMKWADIGADGVWTIPKGHDREKTNAGVLPLPAMAVDIIQAQPKSKNPYVFTGLYNDGHFNGLRYAKLQLDEVDVGGCG